MSWYPADDSRPGMYRPFVTTSVYAPTPTSSTLGRMPLTPAYPVPMEAEVVSRGDFLHVMLRAALGANYLAPITAPSYILDIGCGSGRWVREMAGEFPGARVVGLDVATPDESNPAVSGVFAVVANQPRSYAFVQHNVTEPLAFAPASFDLSHMRQMTRDLPVAIWPRVVGEMVRVTAVGGWVELVEGDLVRNGGPALETMQRWALQAMHQHRLDPRVSSQLAGLLRRLSLTDIRMHTMELPIGPHGGRFGELMGADFMARVEGMRGQIIAARAATREQFAQAQNAIRQEMIRHEYVQSFYVVYGRR
jgi:ubiquinone/menaquinone biosynthesis C-methylase UbiE